MSHGYKNEASLSSFFSATTREKDQMSKKYLLLSLLHSVCSQFVIHPSSVHIIHLYEDVALAFYLTFLLFSCLDGGRDGQQGFQENKDEGASHRRLPGLCQRKQGYTGECVTACQHADAHTPQPHAFHDSLTGQVLGNSGSLFICKSFCVLSICQVCANSVI